MSNDGTLSGDGTSGNGPWRLLILDRDPQDPKCILATVTSPGDVRPARARRRAAILPASAAWVRGLLGQPHANDSDACVARR